MTGLLALLFAGVHFALTLWGYDLPAPVDWVPLLVMALVVGVFETVFFRGFIQTRLEAAYGPVPGIAGAAVLYGLYHVGYGMGGSELLFLTGLGIVYAEAFAQTRSALILWPLLTPLGSFFNAVDSGDIDLPWASIAGFFDVLAIMALAVWLGRRHGRKTHAPEASAADVLAHHEASPRRRQTPVLIAQNRLPSGSARAWRRVPGGARPQRRRTHRAHPRPVRGVAGTVAIDGVVRRPSVRRPGRRLVQLLHGSLDATAFGLHGLHVQPPFGDQAVAYDEDRDPPHREVRPVHVVTVPVPLAPLDVSFHG